MNKWTLCATRMPAYGESIILITHSDLIEEQSEEYISWFAQYKGNNKFLVTDFDSEGAFELSLDPICWMPIPKHPFTQKKA